MGNVAIISLDNKVRTDKFTWHAEVAFGTHSQITSMALNLLLLGLKQTNMMTYSGTHCESQQNSLK